MRRTSRNAMRMRRRCTLSAIRTRRSTMRTKRRKNALHNENDKKHKENEEKHNENEKKKQTDQHPRQENMCIVCFAHSCYFCVIVRFVLELLFAFVRVCSCQVLSAQMMTY